LLYSPTLPGLHEPHIQGLIMKRKIIKKKYSAFLNRRHFFFITAALLISTVTFNTVLANTPEKIERRMAQCAKIERQIKNRTALNRTTEQKLLGETRLLQLKMWSEKLDCKSG
jgi:hypothetical protein